MDVSVVALRNRLPVSLLHRIGLVRTTSAPRAARARCDACW